MKINEKFGQLADDETIKKTAVAFIDKGVNFYIAENSAEARERLRIIIPEGAEIMDMTSETLRALGFDKEIAESGKYAPVRRAIQAPDVENRPIDKKRLGSAHEWTVGSVHAITEDGSLLIASATGSQLPSYAYGADNVVWVAGAQKIVKNIEEGIKRINEYSFPLENERALKVYGMGSGVNKILIINKEVAPNRLNIIIVKEKLGF